MSSEQKRVLVARGAPLIQDISPSRLLHPSVKNTKDNHVDERQDSGLGESFKSASHSHEVDGDGDGDGVTLLSEIYTSKMSMTDRDVAILCDDASTDNRHPEPCSPPKSTTALPPNARPTQGVMNFAQSNDVCWLLAPLRNQLILQNEDGDTPIHLAIIHNQPQVDAFVRVAPINGLNIFNNLRQTPLHLAVITKQSSVVSLLLQAGASIDLVDRHGKTALHLASEYGDTDIMRMLLQSISNTHGSDSWEYDVFLNAKDYKGYSSLQLAVQANSCEAVDLLVNFGANVDLPDGTSGRTALHLAVEDDNLKMVNYLLFNCNASVNAQRYDETTAIHTAAGRGMLAITGRLLAAGADLSITDGENETPLDHATPELLEALKHYL